MIFATCAKSAIRAKFILVNPRQKEVFGERCLPSLRDLPEPVEHAMVIVPAPRVRMCSPTPRPPA